MTMFSNMKLATKLFGSFVIVLALMVGVGSYSISQLAAVNDATVDIATNWLPSVKTATSIKSLLNRVRTYEYRMIADTDPAELASAKKEFDQKVDELKTTVHSYEKLITNSEDRQIHATMVADLTTYQIGRAHV